MQVEGAQESATVASEEQLTEWVTRFVNYRQSPTREALREWLAGFKLEHLAIAHKVLDSVVVVSEVEIHEGYRDALGSLPGWSRKGKERQGRWYFVGVGGAGESGPAMLRLFREANNLTNQGWHEFFVTPRDLPELALSAMDQVVFVDDFAGTGQQMVEYWPLMQELVASEAKCYLLLTAMTTRAQKAINDDTELIVRTRLTLDESANVFSEYCAIFTAEEQAILTEYGAIAWPSHPRGFGDCGLTLVLSHKTPNNSLPILHANHAKWRGPFPRNLLAA